MCETSYGILRGRIKIKKREISRWTGNEKAWGRENKELKGWMYTGVGHLACLTELCA